MEGLKPYVHLLPKGSCNLSQRGRSDGGEKLLLPGEVPRSKLY